MFSPGSRTCPKYDFLFVVLLGTANEVIGVCICICPNASESAESGGAKNNFEQ